MKLHSFWRCICLLKDYVFGIVNTPDSVFNKLIWTDTAPIGREIPWFTVWVFIGTGATAFAWQNLTLCHLIRIWRCAFQHHNHHRVSAYLRVF